ncbi:hypothetical protein EYD45_09200 [Hyunsoonleella flava]|uniref:Uncharacterized protein n=1 Tax=Hyunsoonleella flava TaxID=2527939 RepID=A0A4Q9FD10_9FLAO|nr:hypothetical protein [Hyunsoonleella flava]TBN03683.1 hypothetical protein EYD45_09200 [Hyunsoonleella flava]
MIALRRANIFFVLICAMSILTCKNSKSNPNKNVLSSSSNTLKIVKFGNPIVKDVGMADPHIRIFNGKPMHLKILP